MVVVALMVFVAVLLFVVVCCGQLQTQTRTLSHKPSPPPPQTCPPLHTNALPPHTRSFRTLMIGFSFDVMPSSSPGVGNLKRSAAASSS